MENLLQPVIDQAAPIIALFLAGLAAIALKWIRTQLRIADLTVAEKQLDVRGKLADVARDETEEEAHRRAKNGSDPLGGDAKEAHAVQTYQDVAKDIGLDVAKGGLKKLGGFVLGKVGLGKDPAGTARSAIRSSLGNGR